MDPKGVWRVSPGYDLTFSSGPSGEHCSMVMGEGKKPGIKQLLELAKISNIKQSDALKIIDEVKSSVNKWPMFAKDASVSNASAKLIHSAIAIIIKDNLTSRFSHQIINRLLAHSSLAPVFSMRQHG